MPLGNGTIKAHLFWANGELTKLEQLCAASFVYQGYETLLWTYGDMKNIPNGVQLRDAREILPEGLLFLNQRGSYAGFSDLFRYAVLNQIGGLYADTDVIALKHASYLPPAPFLVTERTGRKKRLKGFIKEMLGLSKGWRINGNVVYNPEPKEGNLVDLAFAYSMRFPKSKVKWSEIGPNLLTAITEIYPDHGYTIQPPDFANPVSYADCPKKLLENKFDLPPQAMFLHCYNEKWRRAGIDKNAPYQATSMMAQYERLFL
jgi:hypothetical protein